MICLGWEPGGRVYWRPCWIASAVVKPNGFVHTFDSSGQFGALLVTCVRAHRYGLHIVLSDGKHQHLLQVSFRRPDVRQPHELRYTSPSTNFCFRLGLAEAPQVLWILFLRSGAGYCRSWVSKLLSPSRIQWKRSTISGSGS